MQLPAEVPLGCEEVDGPSILGKSSATIESVHENK
jgi:hypothetical protein